MGYWKERGKGNEVKISASRAAVYNILCIGEVLFRGLEV